MMSATVERMPNLITSRIAVWCRNYASCRSVNGKADAEDYLMSAVPRQFWKTIREVYDNAKQVKKENNLE